MAPWRPSMRPYLPKYPVRTQSQSLVNDYSATFYQTQSVEVQIAIFKTKIVRLIQELENLEADTDALMKLLLVFVWSLRGYRLD